MKCNASKDNEGNNGRSLACNDECARLERNRKLAVALNIDKSLHTEGGDHIPYSTETLNLFGESPKWAQMQEREFRVFATSDDEKRLRFKPMKSRERVFIHHLAEDFGMDSESMDPEPHRHVMVWKTPRFVSAPNKTLAECLRIRQAQRSAAGSAYNSDAEGKKGKASNEAAEPFNSFIISNPRFGLTVEELRPEVIAVAPSNSPLTFDIEFLPNEEIVLKAMTRSLSAQDVQQYLQSLKEPLAAAIAAKRYGSLQLCCTDSSLNVHRRESETSGGDGWSRVAAKKAAPRMPMSSGPSSGGLNSFAALNGGKVTFAKKMPVMKPPKVKKEPVVDDWEAAETAEEEKEKVVLDGSSGEEDPAAGVKIVPVIEGDTGKAVKLEEEPIVESAEQSGVQSDAEVAVPEPKVDGGSDSVE
jgi:transcriptional repressor NF-X1